MRRQLCFALSLALCSSLAHAQMTTTEDFEAGSNDGAWAFTSLSSIQPAGGNPGAYLEGGVNFMAAYAQASTTATTSVFLGDYASRNVQTIVVDVNELMNAFGANLTISLVLHNNNGTGTPTDDCLVWTTNNTDPTGQGWLTETFFIPATSPNLPGGWNHMTLSGSPCASGDAAWAQVINDVTQVTIFFGRPIDILPFSDVLFGVDNIAIMEDTAVLGTDRCNGDGGDQMGCTDCPCGNNAAMGTIGGCLNSAGTSTRLEVSGDPSVSLPSGVTTDLRFGASGAPGNAFGVLLSGANVAPTNMANPCFGLNSGTQAADRDGLRCAVGATQRHGGRSSDVNGDVGVTNNPWGGEGGPPAGIAANGGFAAGQTRHFQLTHRDDPMVVCMRGLNTSQSIEITFTP